MDNNTIQFSDSNDISTTTTTTQNETLSPPPTTDTSALRLLSHNLQSIFSSSSEFDYYSDAVISLSTGREIAVHLCILAARSPFFKTEFKEGNSKLFLKELVKEYEIGYEDLIGVIGYLYSGEAAKECPQGVCVCADEECAHGACRPVVYFMGLALHMMLIYYYHVYLPGETLWIN